MTDNRNPLPQAVRSSQLQRQSIARFQSVLPVNLFVFRDERVDDAGVDCSLEILIDNQFTNMRTQVQLKSREKRNARQDGIVTLTVETSNFNYLLNGSSGLYVLYIEETNELLYAWATDENQRRIEVNSDWRNQETISIPLQELNEQALRDVYDRIRREAELRREGSKNGLPEKVVQELKKYLVLPGYFDKLRQSILKYPECLPIERDMSSAYKFRTNVQVPEGGTVDCIAARPNSGGIKGYIYYFGSPYENPFTESGEPQRELSYLLELAHEHASIASRPMSSEYVLHPAIVTGLESAGMQQWYFDLREERGFGPYGSLNIYLIIGQRIYHSPMHSDNLFNSITFWQEKFAKFNKSLIKGCDVKLVDILSYSRLMQPFM
jgi:hypothetical protein